MVAKGKGHARKTGRRQQDAHTADQSNSSPLVCRSAGAPRAGAPCAPSQRSRSASAANTLAAATHDTHIKSYLRSYTQSNTSMKQLSQFEQFYIDFRQMLSFIIIC